MRPRGARYYAAVDDTERTTAMALAHEAAQILRAQEGHERHVEIVERWIANPQPP